MQGLQKYILKSNKDFMEMKFSQSPVKTYQPMKVSSHSHSKDKVNFTPKPPPTSRNHKVVNINQLSAKIEGVQKRIKNQQPKNCILRNTLQGGRPIDLLSSNKNKANLSRPLGNDARASWDNTIELNFLRVPDNNQETYRNSFDINSNFPTKNKLNQIFKSKSPSASYHANKTVGMERQPVKKQKSNDFSVSQIRGNVSECSDTKKSQEIEKENKVKTRIQKSIQMLQLLKNNQFGKAKKEKPRQSASTTDNETVNGFKLGRLLGKGKFGHVYLSVHVQTSFVVAIKKILKEKLLQYNLVEQFIKEIKIHNSLDNPKIVKFYGVFQEKEYFYLVLQYMNGGTLFDYLNVVKTIRIKEAVQFLKDIVEAVTEMHDRSIAHRDIKPQNIVINTEGVAKLCDFGWAALVDKNRNTYCGTLEYVSPEILERKSYDQSVDIWSLGILTYQMLMGRAPFENYDRSLMKQKIMHMDLSELEFSENVPEEARDFIKWLVQKDPSKRPKIREILSHRMFSKYSPSKGQRKVLQ